MKWNNHYNLTGKHAILSPSGYSWLNYDPDKMRNIFLNKLKVEQGTYLHDLASRLINNRFKLLDLPQAFNMFVNDAIAARMDSEVLLYYSDNCFGTADAIKFDEDNNALYIYDLKTGDSKPSFKQLHIYCALFCLEYGYTTKRVTNRMHFVCRLYQGDSYEEEIVEPAVVFGCMQQIINMDNVISDLKLELEGQ